MHRYRAPSHIGNPAEKGREWSRHPNFERGLRPRESPVPVARRVSSRNLNPDIQDTENIGHAGLMLDT